MAVSVSIIEANGLSAYLARPERPSRSGVLLLPGRSGMNDDARAEAQAMAEAGLTTVVCNQYTGRPSLVPTDEEAARWAAELNDRVVFKQQASWIGYMVGELGLEAVGAMGFSQGGRFALLLGAQDRRLAACVSIYPTITSPLRPNQELDPVALAAEIRCPVMIIYPGQDAVTNRQSFGALRDTLEARSEATTSLVYPAGDHGFMMRPYEPAHVFAARSAWAQAIAFLTSSLAAT